MGLAAPTRSGKTSTLRVVANHLLWTGWDIYGSDYKVTGLRWLQDRPGVQEVGLPWRSAVRAVHSVREVVDLRLRQLERGRPVTLTPTALLLDERAGLVDRAREEDSKLAAQLESDLDAILRLGGELEVHAFIGIQRPDVRWWSGESRDNTRAWTVHGVLSPDGKQMVHRTDRVDHSGLGVPGRTLLDVDGQTTRFRAYWLPEPDDNHPHATPAGVREARRWIPTYATRARKDDT